MPASVVTRDEVRKRVDAAYKYVTKYHRWIGDDNLALLDGIRKLVMEEDEVADQLALILEQER